MATTKATTPPAAEEESLADAIRRISSAFENLQKSGLNRHAIVTLVSADSKVGKRDVEKVLSTLKTLERTYTKASR